MLKVLKAGFFTTIQDKGRFGFASIGIPISGAMDSFSADLANAVLNNSIHDAVLEIILGFCKLQFTEPTSICISGGDFSPKLNQTIIPLNKRILVNKNDVITFGKINFGVRCYVAISGGFLTDKVLNSRSFYPNVSKDSKIKIDDSLLYKPFIHNDKNSTTSSIRVNNQHFISSKISCYKGPEFDLLNQYQQEKLVEQIFSISKDNSRMGYKLNEELENNLPQILTSAVLPGTVQLTPSGKLIVLMRDCQVTGGYPRVLQLTEIAINQLAQKTTGASFQFSLKSI